MTSSDSLLIAVVCEICGHHVAMVDLHTLGLPILGSMFSSPMPGQLPDPFPPEVDWEFMFCPMCRKRPFTRDDRLPLAGGVIDVAAMVQAREAKTVEKHAVAVPTVEIPTPVEAPPAPKHTRKRVALTPEEMGLLERAVAIYERSGKLSDVGQILGITMPKVRLLLHKAGLLA